MRTVAVVDYGMGNLRSVTQAVLHAVIDDRDGSHRFCIPVLVSRESPWWKE
jgi:imidazoleglycerol phosphate synthase glutamine amidotransferase subunit HisH